ncbi:MAG: GAF domain-containing sensor histidine kinase, partial [Chloroflexota bacterium]
EVGDDEVGDDEPAEVAPETIELTVGMGYFANHIGMPMKHGEGIGGYVWDTGETVILDDYNRWENRTTRYANHAAFQAAIGVPIYSGATVTGVIGLVYDEKGRTFTKNEIDLMTRFSHLASIALDNARLYAASQQEIAERLRFEEALVHERSLLAERVEERTADLQAANIKLARSARLKDEFLASMSHELRTPLNAILGLSESLGEQIYGNLNDQQMHSLKIIERSGQHLLTLINDVLDVAKIEAGELHFELAMTDIEATVQSSIVMVTQEAERKQLDLSVDLDESLNKIEADPRRLKQILVNLLSNAVKFTPDNGSIGLEAHRVEDEDDPTIQLVEFSVWDTGIGIAKPDMPKLFQPFQQIDSSLSRQYNGTGLGLALVKRLTEMHHGEVSLLSTVGQGSRFIVTIPERQPRRRR